MTETTIYVSNLEELYQALGNANGGETILLAGGNYGGLSLETTKTFGTSAVYDEPVVITSADPDNQAIISALKIDGAKNLYFDGVTFKSTYSGGDVWTSQFQISNSTDIGFRNSIFEGQIAAGSGDPTTDGFPTGKGLVINGCTNVVIEGNEFSTWHRALVVGGSQNLNIVGNEIYNIRSDGMDFAQVQNVSIKNNYIHDFLTSGASADHADMIQFWTNGTTSPSTDITISGNILDVGAGGGTQSIFMRNDLVDRGLAGEEMFYRNILIEENIILNNHTHGITVGETDGLIIRKNSVLDADPSVSSTVATPKINVSRYSTDVLIESNVAAAINGYATQSTWILSNNVFVQNADRNAFGYYESEFLSSTIDGQAIDIVVNPFGAIASFSAGASRLHLDTSPTETRPIFNIRSDTGKDNTLLFDASFTFGPDGPISDTDFSLLWDFGDGTSAVGRYVSHTYHSPGHYTTKLSIVSSYGEINSAAAVVSVAGADLVSFDKMTGTFFSHSYGEDIEVSGSGKSSTTSQYGAMVDIGDPTDAIGISVEHFERLFGADNFDMHLTFASDKIGSTGEILRSHGNFLLRVLTDGNLEFQLSGVEHYAKVATRGVNVSDGIIHDVRIVLDPDTQKLSIVVDGSSLFSVDMFGPVRHSDPRGLEFGSGWGKPVFDGKLASFQLSVSSSDYPAYEGATDWINSIMQSEGLEESLTDSDPEVGSAVDTMLDQNESSSAENILQSADFLTFNLDFEKVFQLDFGKLVGNARVEKVQDQFALVLDGQQDSLRIGDVTQDFVSQSISFEIEVSATGATPSREVLLSYGSTISLSLDGEKIVLLLGSDRSEFQQSIFEAQGFDFDTSNSQRIGVVIDDNTDRVQISVDDHVALDVTSSKFDLSLNLSKESWWNSGWTIGEGGRRENDFEGVVTAFGIQDAALFLDV